MTNLDDKDLQMIAALSHDGRLTVTSLADMVGMTRQAVAERLTRLEREQVIRGYTVIVDEEAVGLKARALMSIRMFRGSSLEDDRTIVELLEACPWVRDCYHVAGDDCYMIRIVAPDAGTINELIINLRRTGLVEVTHTWFALANAFEKSAIGPLNVSDISHK